jgi:hypothetical protein
MSVFHFGREFVLKRAWKAVAAVFVAAKVVTP